LNEYLNPVNIYIIFIILLEYNSMTGSGGKYSDLPAQRTDTPNKLSISECCAYFEF